MTPTRIIIHCSDTPNGKPVTIDEIESWHKARGFKKIGYHFVIGVGGFIDRGRGDNEKGAHCKGSNHDSIGICLVGRDKYSKAQWDSLFVLINELLKTHGIDPWQIFCHRQMPSAITQKKTCPGVPYALLTYAIHLGITEVLSDHTIDHPPQT